MSWSKISYLANEIKQTEEFLNKDRSHPSHNQAGNLYDDYVESKSGYWIVNIGMGSSSKVEDHAKFVFNKLEFDEFMSVLKKNQDRMIEEAKTGIAGVLNDT